MDKDYIEMIENTIDVLEDKIRKIKHSQEILSELRLEELKKK